MTQPGGDLTSALRRPPGNRATNRAANKEPLLVRLRRHGHIEESDHHFLIGLIAPGHDRYRIRVVRIVARVVIPGDRAHPRSSLQQSRLCEAITQLPVKVIIHAQQRFDRSVTPHSVVFEALPAQVHMGKQAEQRGIVGQRALRPHSKVSRARGDDERVIVQLQSDDPCAGGFLANTRPMLLWSLPGVPLVV